MTQRRLRSLQHHIMHLGLPENRLAIMEWCSALPLCLARWRSFFRDRQHPELGGASRVCEVEWVALRSAVRNPKVKEKKEQEWYTARKSLGPLRSLLEFPQKRQQKQRSQALIRRRIQTGQIGTGQGMPGSGAVRVCRRSR